MSTDSVGRATREELTQRCQKCLEVECGNYEHLYKYVVNVYNLYISPLLDQA